MYNNVNQYEYLVDGLLFYHKDSFYTHGVNPDVLLWKDNKITTFISHTNQTI